jgi:ABC-type multidrug transport system fused ATPase/permease subunit
MGAIGIIATISAVLPAFLLASFFIVIGYYLIGYVYLASSRGKFQSSYIFGDPETGPISLTTPYLSTELKRSESVSKSPIFSLFGETLNGVSSIRSYGDSGRFTRKIFALLDTNNRPFFALWLGNRWLSVRIDFAGSFVSLLAALFVLFSEHMDAATAGFILSFSIALNERTLWCVRLWSMNEINFNSVERVKECKYTLLSLLYFLRSLINNRLLILEIFD